MIMMMMMMMRETGRIDYLFFKKEKKEKKFSIQLTFWLFLVEHCITVSSSFLSLLHYSKGKFFKLWIDFTHTGKLFWIIVCCCCFGCCCCCCWMKQKQQQQQILFIIFHKFKLNLFVWLFDWIFHQTRSFQVDLSSSFP